MSIFSVVYFPSLTNKMAFRWRANDGPTFNAGLVALYFFREIGPASLYGR